MLWLVVLPKQRTQKDWYHETHISDHLPSGLISFSVVGPFLFLLQNPLPGGTVLQGKFTDDPAELVYVHLPNCIRWMTHKEQKGMESAVKNNSGHDFSFKEQRPIVWKLSVRNHSQMVFFIPGALRSKSLFKWKLPRRQIQLIFSWMKGMSRW